MSYFGRENSWNDIFVLLDLIWRRVDVAVKEIGVEVVDDFLHRLSRSTDCSVWASEADHLVFVIGEGSSGVADALPNLCRFYQYFCSSLF